jgi:hypothetical protein
MVVKVNLKTGLDGGMKCSNHEIKVIESFKCLGGHGHAMAEAVSGLSAGFSFEFFGFLQSVSFHCGSPYSYIIWGMNNRLIGGCNSETWSHPIYMNMNKCLGCHTRTDIRNYRKKKNAGTFYCMSILMYGTESWAWTRADVSRRMVADVIILWHVEGETKRNIMRNIKNWRVSMISTLLGKLNT